MHRIENLYYYIKMAITITTAIITITIATIIITITIATVTTASIYTLILIV